MALTGAAENATASETDPANANANAAQPRKAKALPPLAKLVGMIAGLGVILFAMLMLFIMPSLKSGPHDLPVGVTGDSAAVETFEQALENAAPGAYEVQTLDSEAELTEAIRDREVVGGFAVTEAGVSAYTASAGSAVISSTIAGTAKAIGGDVPVTDVVPLPAEDPTGIGIGGLAFPLVFGGIVPAVAFRKVFPRSLGWTVAGIASFAAIGGIAVAAVLMFSFGSITAGFWAVAGSMALGIAALGLPLAGLQEVFGGKGFTIGAMAMMFLGNPLAGISTTAAWLPAGLGIIGQILPPGATGTLVRSAAYFGGSGGLVAALTLVAWIVGGAVLLALGKRRARRVAAE
ncbi:hypothetical protein [Homoserinimonas hongtaonis]|uniref:hypothetical protein n=1 Tax=Homoserinimonas hongtaonis TaxID=2079791 RepID=UPI0018EEC924|nr:hypothetical protein [Salinibacterium hongtaonis]